MQAVVDKRHDDDAPMMRGRNDARMACWRNASESSSGSVKSMCTAADDIEDEAAMPPRSRFTLPVNVSKIPLQNSSTYSRVCTRCHGASDGVAGRLMHLCERDFRALTIVLDGHDGSGSSPSSPLGMLVLCGDEGRLEARQQMRLQPRFPER